MLRCTMCVLTKMNLPSETLRIATEELRQEYLGMRLKDYLPAGDMCTSQCSSIWLAVCIELRLWNTDC